MPKSKVTAERVLEALEKNPELLKEVKERLNPEPRTAFAVLMVEHEFGQRDEGWTLHPTYEEAMAHKKEMEGPGAPGQYFSYEGPRAFPVDVKVWALLEEEGSLSSKSNHWHPEGELVTLEHVRQ